MVGDAGAAIWSAELERTGRVVFPQRALPVVLRLAFVLLVGLRPIVESIWRISHDSEDWWYIYNLIAASGFLVLAAACVWQLITRRPALTVDQRGIRLGRRPKNDLPWSQIGSIGNPTGPKRFPTITIQPPDRWASPLTIGKGNIQDLTEFAHWLQTLHARHTRSATDHPVGPTTEPS